MSAVINVKGEGVSGTIPVPRDIPPQHKQCSHETSRHLQNGFSKLFIVLSAPAVLRIYWDSPPCLVKGLDGKTTRCLV